MLSDYQDESEAVREREMLIGMMNVSEEMKRKASRSTVLGAFRWLGLLFLLFSVFFFFFIFPPKTNKA